MTINKIIVIFTEGETDAVFYKELCNYFGIRELKSTKVVVKNLKGVSRYENKAPAKLKYEVMNKYPKAKIIVFCSYDTDIFEIPFQQKPPVDWKKVEKKIKDIGIEKVYHIKAVKMIEDWFLLDKINLCTFLKITCPKRLTGSNAYEKMKTLFKKGKKVYQKGSNVHKFVNHLNIEKIYRSLDTTFDKLKEELSKN